MKKLIACALLGLGLTQSLVACSDDDGGGDDTAGASGAAGTSAGSDTGGKNGGGAAQDGGAAGQASGGNSGNGGTAGKGGGGNGGTTSQGGDGSAGEPSTNLGGDNAGGDTASGGVGGDGAGGAPPEEPVQTPTPHWLSYYCDAKASDTLGCTGSPAWHDCYGKLAGFLSGEGGDLTSVCEGDSDDNGWAKTLAMIAAMDALAAACPDPEVEDWSCNLEGQPEPNDAACREAEAARVQAYKACLLP